MAVLTPGIGTGKPVNAAASDDPFAFTGVPVDNTHDDNTDPKNVSAEQFGYWLQNAMLKLLDIAGKGGLAIPVRNESGGTLTKKTTVYISGWSSANTCAIISKADANDVAKIATWVLQADIANNANGTAYPYADVTDIDTSGASAVGSKVYQSGTAGEFVYADPGGILQYGQELGVVTVKHATTGAIRFYPGARKIIRWPIGAGGTGATTAAGARTALGATTAGSNMFTAADVAAQLAILSAAGAFSKIYFGTLTRNLATTDGDQNITGVGFKPRLIIFLGGKDGTTAMSFGLGGTVDGGANILGAEIFMHGTSWELTASFSTKGVARYRIGTAYDDATLTALGNDGFTLTWARHADGSEPTGTFYVHFVALA